MIDDAPQRPLARGATSDQRLKAGNLPIGRRTAGGDAACVGHLLRTAERLGVFAEHGDELLDEVADWDELALAEVEQGAANAVALRAPAVFRQKEERIGAPRLIGPA